MPSLPRPLDLDLRVTYRVRYSATASAVFIENRRLYSELQQMMLSLVRALVSSVDAKDPYTCGHSERVAITCREITGQLAAGELNGALDALGSFEALLGTVPSLPSIPQLPPLPVPPALPALPLP